eukprot:3541824-Pleurochrysis_carterae.AAC.2
MSICALSSSTLADSRVRSTCMLWFGVKGDVHSQQIAARALCERVVEAERVADRKDLRIAATARTCGCGGTDPKRHEGNKRNQLNRSMAA